MIIDLSGEFLVSSAPRPVTILVASLLAACGAASPQPSATPVSSAAVVKVPSAPESSAAGRIQVQAPGHAHEALGPPEGYVEVSVRAVTPSGEGPVVLLVDESSQVVLPIFIGPGEAMAIDLRQRKERYQRPLTHDLLEAIMRELGGSLLKVQIDDVKGNTFVGAVFVRTGTRVVEIDARPSDAIALALGSRVPIYVARKVVEQAGIHPRDRSEPGLPGSPSRL